MTAGDTDVVGPALGTGSQRSLRETGAAVAIVGKYVTEPTPAPRHPEESENLSRSEPKTLRFHVLGALECRAGTRRVGLGGRVQERVLVSLLLERGRVLPIARLVEAVWGNTPPVTAMHQVRKAVARLRQVIPGGSELIITEGCGYRAVTNRVYLDLEDFLAKLREARQAIDAGLSAEPVGMLQQALALWSDPIRSCRGGHLPNAAPDAVVELRLAAVEQLMELRLNNGDASELVDDLAGLVAANPLREGLSAQLMLALYRSGRRAEALAAYARLHRLLAGELGIAPDARLTRLHEAILREDRELATPQPSSGHPRSWATTAHQCSLPCDVPDFTGREQELRSLLDYAHHPAAHQVRVVAIDGMGGAGKTALAVHAAHLLAEHYPDAQLYVDLRGFTPGRQQLSTETVAETLLRALGVPADRIPRDARRQIAEWRTVAARHRLVLVLDNAANAAQVRPLLPAGQKAVVLVTSRARLVDLDSAHCVSLGTMPPETSIAMLAGALGDDRVDSEPDATAALAELCGHLPLALRVVSARLHNQPKWRIGQLVELLGDESRRLDELRFGEQSVELTLTLSYRGLEPAHRNAVRLLALHPGCDIDVHSAAALLGTTLDEAEDVLEHLLDAHLVQQPELGCYTFHDLVRSFAQRLGDQDGSDAGHAAGNDDQAGRRAAVARLLRYYVLSTDRACDLAFPGRVGLEPALRECLTALPPLRTAEHARKWLEHEQDTLREAVMLAYRMGFHEQAATLARNVVFQLDAAEQFEGYREVAQAAVASSRRLGHAPLLRMSLSNLAIANWKLGRFYEGIAAATEGRHLAVRLGDRRGEAKDTGVLGVLLGTLGQFDEALARLQESIAIKRELDAGRAEAESLTNLSTLYEQWGHYEEAAAAAHRALELNRELGSRENELVSLADLASAYLGLDQDRLAQACLDQATDLVDESSPSADWALVLALSAKVAHRAGLRGPASVLAGRALTLCRVSRTPIRQTRIENILGCLEFSNGRHESALRLYNSAHRTASEVGYQVEEARALRGLAQTHEAIGNATLADRYLRQAEGLFDKLRIQTRFRRAG